MKIQFFLICFILMSIINNIKAMEVINIEDIGKPSSSWYYYDSTAFVNFPAYVGYNVMFSVGTLTLMSCSNRAIYYSHNYFGHLGYLVFGAPFYLLEATFYDFPIYMWDSMFGSDDKEEIVKDVMNPNNESPPTLKDSTNPKP